MTTRFADHLLTGDHASRPSASAVPEGTLYSCTTHDLVYQSTAGSWGTWLTAGGGSVAALDDVGDVNAPTPSDGDVLTYDTGGGEWIASAPTGGGGGDLTFLSETVLGSANAEINVTGISTSYRDLIIVGRFRSATASTKVVRMRLGDSSAIDTGNNYSYNRNYNGTLANGASQTTGVSYIEAGALPGSGSTAGYFGAGRWELIDYASTARSRVVFGQTFDDANDGNFMNSVGGMWRNVTAAVERVRLLVDDGSNFDTGSAMAVYGRG